MGLPKPRAISTNRGLSKSKSALPAVFPSTQPDYGESEEQHKDRFTDKKHLFVQVPEDGIDENGDVITDRDVTNLLFTAEFI